MKEKNREELRHTMKSGRYSLSMFLAISMSCFPAAAQQSATTQSSAPPPRLVNFAAKAADAQGKPPAANCSYTFTSGGNNTYLGYCVTVNGNILEIQTPFGQNMLGPNGEGYGICNESPGQNYDDYGVSDSGNWGNAVLLSQNSASVKIARTTADGNWTLTQTITMVPKTVSITLAMALKNNQAADHIAYLVRFADAEPLGFNIWMASLNSAWARTLQRDPNYGLQLSNVGIPQFSYWQGFAQSVNTGPNACAFAFNEGLDNWYSSDQGPGSIEMVYAGTVAAGRTKTVTLSYHAL